MKILKNILELFKIKNKKEIKISIIELLKCAKIGDLFLVNNYNHLDKNNIIKYVGRNGVDHLQFLKDNNGVSILVETNRYGENPLFKITKKYI